MVSIDSSVDQKYMSLALEQAEKCIGTPTAFCVGAVIVLPRNTEGNTSEEGIISFQSAFTFQATTNSTV